MPFKDRVTDLLSNFGHKLALIVFVFLLWKLNFYLIQPTEQSTISLLASTPWSAISLMFMLVFFLSYSLLFIIHEILKLIGLEQKGDIRFSTILALSFMATLFVRNLMTLLDTEQFSLIVTLIGFPFLTTVPLLFKKILMFDAKESQSEFVSVNFNNQKMTDYPQKKYNRRYHKIR